MSSSPLFINDLVIDYGQKMAVDHVSFELKAGEIFGLLGPNGAGKTSIISAITSLTPYQSGEIQIFGKACGSVAAKRNIGLVPQELVSHGFFSVAEVLRFQAGYFGVKKAKDRIEWLLKKLQLWDMRDKKIPQLSGGMKRRLLIAKALLHSPKLLLLDEPSAGVDIELREILWNFVRELHQEGMTIVLTTHYLEEAERLCDRIGVIHHGKLLALDETRALKSSLQGRVLEIELKELRAIDRTKLGTKILDLNLEGRLLRVCFSPELDLKDLLDLLGLKLEEIHGIREAESRLEDAFKRILRKDVA